MNPLAAVSLSSASLSRRDVLRAAATLPLFGPLLRWAPDAVDASLLVLELEGGNDGLNTLIPLGDAAFARARPQLGSVRQGAHALAGSDFALHPSLQGLAGVFARGAAAAIHGVGYPEPDRSHFRSRDIWHSADVTYDATRSSATGWLGRAADVLLARGAPVPALAVGALRLPLALRGERVVVPVLERLDDFALRGAGGAQQEALTGLATAEARDGLQAFVAGVARGAIRSAEALQQAMARYRARAEYPADGLGTDLQLAARALVSGFGTRLLHVAFGGFDTHSQQLPTHAQLLRQVGDGLAALVADLEAHDQLAHTVIVVCSEFGRRVAENGTLGTDHGAAAPVFVLGGGVRPGLHGTPPDLGDLVDGDVRSTTDFRAVYATLLQRMDIPVDDVLGGAPAALALF